MDFIVCNHRIHEFGRCFLTSWGVTGLRSWHYCERYQQSNWSHSGAWAFLVDQVPRFVFLSLTSSWGRSHYISFNERAMCNGKRSQFNPQDVVVASGEVHQEPLQQRQLWLQSLSSADAPQSQWHKKQERQKNNTWNNKNKPPEEVHYQINFKVVPPRYVNLLWC